MPQVKVVTILHLVEVLGSRETILEVSEGTTVAGLLTLLAERCDPAAVGQIFADRDGTLQPSITVMLNGRLLVFAGGLEAILAEGDEILVLPAVGGG